MSFRQIYTVSVTQVVVSENHPEGLVSNVSGYPVTRDSRTYKQTVENPNGDPETALIVAQADYSAAIRDLTTADNQSRVMWTVTLTRWDGVQIAKKAFGAFPDMTPQPEPEPEAEPEETAGEEE